MQIADWDTPASDVWSYTASSDKDHSIAYAEDGCFARSYSIFHFLHGFNFMDPENPNNPQQSPSIFNYMQLYNWQDGKPSMALGYVEADGWFDYGGIGYYNKYVAGLYRKETNIEGKFIYTVRVLWFNNFHPHCSTEKYNWWSKCASVSVE